jgi:hypothetical protein
VVELSSSIGGSVVMSSALEFDETTDELSSRGLVGGSAELAAYGRELS